MASCDDLALIHEFAVEARRFREWLLKGKDEGVAAARAAQERILALYARGIALPALDVDCDHNVSLDKGEVDAVAQAMRRMPL